MSSINEPDERTFVYEDSPLQFTVGGSEKRIVLVKSWTFTPNMSDFDIDRIDTATPVFTKKSDILGTFTFNTVNTVDFYDPGSAADPTTYAFWATQIALGEPPNVTFLITMRAPNASGNQFANIAFVARVMSVPQNRNQDTGVHTFTVNGEINDIISVTRDSS